MDCVLVGPFFDCTFSPPPTMKLRTALKTLDSAGRNSVCMICHHHITLKYINALYRVSFPSCWTIVHRVVT